MKKVKDVLIITITLVAMYKAMESFEVMMLVNWKATLTLMASSFILWLFWKANCQEEYNGKQYIE